MIKYLTPLFFLIISCAPIQGVQAQKPYKELTARVTYYWGDTKTATGNKPVSGKTLAVDPRIIPYGTKVSIPAMNKTFVSHDTGMAIKSRLASRKLGKNNIVVDVFCKNSAEARLKIKKYPMFLKIRIYE